MLLRAAFYPTPAAGPPRPGTEAAASRRAEGAAAGPGRRSTGNRGFRPSALWRREGSADGFWGIGCRDGVAAAAHRAALVAGGAGAGLQSGAHDAAGHQHLPGGHRAQVPTLLGERGRARPTRLRCPASPEDCALAPAREAAAGLLPNPLVSVKKRKEIVQR